MTCSKVPQVKTWHTWDGALAEHTEALPKLTVLKARTHSSLSQDSQLHAWKLFTILWYALFCSELHLPDSNTSRLTVIIFFSYTFGQHKERWIHSDLTWINTSHHYKHKPRYVYSAKFSQLTLTSWFISSNKLLGTYGIFSSYSRRGSYIHWELNSVSQNVRASSFPPWATFLLSHWTQLVVWTQIHRYVFPLSPCICPQPPCAYPNTKSLP